jgi:tetratricopeptide (TPR) repeat protein
VLAAIASGEPFASDIPGREHEECFPPALRQKFDRRGRPTGKRAEPLAADLRDQGDERRTGVLKLVAGMLGVGLDDLVQRDATRRHRRLGFLAAASLAGMAVTSGLAITALQARDSARDQRREAEGLVAFMLGDLKDKLEPIGRLDALDGVGSRVLAYYSNQDASELSDAALMQRSRALSLTAQVAHLRGSLDESARLYSEARAGTQEAVRRAPDDPQRLFDHAQNVFWIGEIARERGRMSEAEAAYREYKRLADTMVAIEPDNLRWRMEALYGEENIGIVLRNQRRFAESAQHFSRALHPMQSLASIEPQNSEYQKELSTVLAWLADAERDLGKLDAAIRLRERQIRHLQGLVARPGTSVVFRQQLIPARQALGILLTSRGQYDQGIEQLRQATAEGDRLVALEPENNFVKGLAAQARLELAGTLLSRGHADAARAEVVAGCGLARDVLARDSAGAFRRLQTSCLSLRSRLALGAAAVSEALRLAASALASARTEASADPISVRYSIAAAYRLVGDAHERAGDAPAATAAWSAGLAQLPVSIRERPAEMNERMQLLRRLQRTADARELADRLAEMGYRGIV